jgi:hypothetical protein
VQQLSRQVEAVAAGSGSSGGGAAAAAGGAPLAELLALEQRLNERQARFEMALMQVGGLTRCVLPHARWPQRGAGRAQLGQPLVRCGSCSALPAVVSRDGAGARRGEVRLG